MNPAIAAPGVATVPRLFPGETVVVIGGGTSLTPEDVAYCQGRARVVAIKEAYLLAPWADVLYACESKWWQHYQGAPTFAGLKYALLPDAQDHPAAPSYLDVFQRFPDVQLLRHTGAEGLELDPSGLRHGYNSGHQAINVAVHLGASRIVLLGFDMSRGPTGEQNWFGAHPNHLTGSPYPIFAQHMHTLVEPLKALGVEVLNASRFTVLTAFPRVSLEEALA
jgi:hypothetical protein